MPGAAPVSGFPPKPFTTLQCPLHCLVFFFGNRLNVDCATTGDRRRKQPNRSNRERVPAVTTDTAPERPNFLMIMVDQLRYPRLGYGSAGLVDPIKAILSFVGDIENNPYAKHFPGFCKLREHAVVLTDHSIAESACARTPSWSSRPTMENSAARTR